MCYTLPHVLEDDIMKNRRWFTLAIMLTAVAGAFALAAPLKKPVKMFVQTRPAEVRASPTPLGKVVAVLGTNDQITATESTNLWFKVSTSDGLISGWMHSSALAKEQVKLESGAQDAQVAASSGEMAHATKGFTEQIEKEFRDKNKEINFAWVDKMQTFAVTENAMRSFLAEGQVEQKEGAQ
jgi:hypothetical protein